MEAPNIRTGSGRELRKQHDVVSRHVWSLETIKGDRFEAFLSASIEIKLDQESKFVCQQHTHVQRDVQSIDELLEFIHSRAQASELSTSRNTERRVPVIKKEKKSRTSYQVMTKWKYVGCNEATHLLYTCGSFQSLTSEERLAKARKHRPCLTACVKGTLLVNAN